MKKLEGLLNYVRDQCLEAREQTALAPETWAALKSIEDLVGEMKDMLRDVTIMELEKYGKEGFSRGGYHMTVKSGAGKYNFKTVPEWVSLNDRMKKLEELAKLASRATGRLVDDDGVAIPPAVYIPGSYTVNCTKLKEEQL